MTALQPSLRNLLKCFSVYEFLWKDDVIGNFREFVHLNCETCVIVREVERLLAIENQVTMLPPVLHCGSICLITHPLKETLIGFAAAWKNLYASGLMEEAKVGLLSRALSFSLGLSLPLSLSFLSS